MRRRKIWLAAGCIAAACIIFFVWFFRPRPLIHDLETFQIGSIFYYENATPYYTPAGKDVTHETDAQELGKVLSSYECAATPWPTGRYLMADVVLEINCVHNRKALHIVLGKDNFCYEHAGATKYAILNGKELTEELLEMLNL